MGVPSVDRNPKVLPLPRLAACSRRRRRRFVGGAPAPIERAGRGSMRSCCAVFAGVRATRELRRSGSAACVRRRAMVRPPRESPGGPLTHRRSTRPPTSLRPHHDVDRGPDALRAAGLAAAQRMARGGDLSPVAPLDGPAGMLSGLSHSAVVSRASRSHGVEADQQGGVEGPVGDDAAGEVAGRQPQGGKQDSADKDSGERARQADDHEQRIGLQVRSDRKSVV